MSKGKYHIHIQIVDFSIDKYLTLQREYIIITTVIYKNKNGNIYILIIKMNTENVDKYVIKNLQL